MSKSSLKVKTYLHSGGLTYQHSRRALKVRAGLKAGGVYVNHARSMLAADNPAYSHGHNRRGHRSSEYISWANMITRCSNQRGKDYLAYGAKGIKVCERWRLFANFLTDMGARPSGTSIDRIDGTRGYEPGNCRWATRKEQNSNRRNVHQITIGGETASVAEWARRAGVHENTVYARIRRGVPHGELFSPAVNHNAIQRALAAVLKHADVIRRAVRG